MSCTKISVIARSKTWFGLLCTIRYFIIFCSIVTTVYGHAVSSFWQDSDSDPYMG